jgi:hypothetical protein
MSTEEQIKLMKEVIHESSKQAVEKSLHLKKWFKAIVVTVVSGVILMLGGSYITMRIMLSNHQKRITDLEQISETHEQRLDNHTAHIRYFRELHELDNDPVITRGGGNAIVPLLHK